MDQSQLDKIIDARLEDASNPDGLSEGDIVITENGTKKRIGHIYEDGSYQLTQSSGFFCDKGDHMWGKPCLGRVHLSSGGLDSSIENKLAYIGVEEAHAWTWRETACAGGGMDIKVPFRLFKLVPKDNDQK